MSRTTKQPYVGVYTTSFCNQLHRLEDGKPVNHECYVLNPKALEAEHRDDFATANLLLSQGPKRPHKGLKVDLL